MDASEWVPLAVGGGGLLGGAGAAMSRNSDLVAYAGSCLRWAYGVLAEMEAVRDAKFARAPMLPEGPPPKPKVWFPPLGWFETIEDRANDVRAAVAEWGVVIGKDTTKWAESFAPTHTDVAAKVTVLRDTVLDVGRASVVWCGPRFARMVRADRLAREHPLEAPHVPFMASGGGGFF